MESVFMLCAKVAVNHHRHHHNSISETQDCTLRHYNIILTPVNI